jgi:hypothetical protein
MLNSAVLHLASITEVGTLVTVVNSLPEQRQVNRGRSLARESIVPTQSKDPAPPVANEVAQRAVR